MGISRHPRALWRHEAFWRAAAKILNVSPRALTTTLRHLEEQGVLEREIPYRSGYGGIHADARKHGLRHVCGRRGGLDFKLT